MQGLAQISKELCCLGVTAVACWLAGCAQSVPVVGAASSDAAASAINASTSSSGTASGSATTTPVSTTTVAPLSIQGSPATTVIAGSAYAFEPSVSQNTGTVTFTIANQPKWASFDSSTGALTGTPSLAYLGTTANITITANDATGAALIGPFDITVTAPAANPPGSATLTWVAPTLNTNGTPLTDLAGYHIYYGTSAMQLSQKVILDGASTTTYVINGLTTGTYYFVVTAVSSAGTESTQSNLVTKTL